MLTIGIVFYDRDYNNVPRLLEQIERFVKVEHEVITVSNCERTTEEELFFEPTFSFGYNARILKARKKIFELSKGDYIWYVDADDTIIGDLDMRLSEDMHVFNAVETAGWEMKLAEETLEGDFMSFDLLNRVCMGLWNKVVRKAVLAEFIGGLYDDGIVAMEDVSVVIGCLRFARTIRLEPATVYQHELGFSNRKTADEDTMRMISMGHAKSVENIMRLAEGTGFEMDRLIDDRARYYFSKIDFTDIPLACRLLRMVLPLFSECGGVVRDLWLHDVAFRLGTRERYDYVRDVFSAHFPEENFLKVRRTCKEERYEDGRLVEFETEFWCDPVYFE